MGKNYVYNKNSNSKKNEKQNINDSNKNTKSNNIDRIVLSFSGTSIVIIFFLEYHAKDEKTSKYKSFYLLTPIAIIVFILLCLLHFC